MNDSGPRFSLEDCRESSDLRESNEFCADDVVGVSMETDFGSVLNGNVLNDE